MPCSSQTSKVYYINQGWLPLVYSQGSSIIGQINHAITKYLIMLVGPSFPCVLITVRVWIGCRIMSEQKRSYSDYAFHLLMVGVFMLEWEKPMCEESVLEYEREEKILIRCCSHKVVLFFFSLHIKIINVCWIWN